MPSTPQLSRGARTRHRVLDAAARLLAKDPGASLGEIAAAAGIGRTTVHRHYPTRDDLLQALAFDALAAIAEGVGEVPMATEPPERALLALATALLPLGPRVSWLANERSLTANREVLAGFERVARPLSELVEREQAAGRFAPHLAPHWVVQVFVAVLCAAWEAVDNGELAPRAAPELVVETVLRGVAR
ncbi:MULTISPECIES: TetR/AcrR family transcriptional regulator [unclassified Crossiella]|uniref:TetR/AcrR family transcriptional regulator n=1 Tax=unclassified Crossiella TaxID=2620835 RepID=UPI002000229A|nr:MULTISPECIES: TetR/AcrR family transcriptional regulator [unclassified Crossiella]MCK2242062.1 TetR/AcrR family transcriptional regulator [Crossiella sp. S99.2]MCK2255965.1 TetR/AcrR family transcriptional regulator [Crossiella sp. S99.1]